MMASCLLFKASALTMIVRTVCPRSEGTSLPRMRMRILPSLSSFTPNGGAAQPMSTWPDITCVSVAAGPPVAGVLPERRGLVLPIVDLADRDLELVLRLRRGAAQRDRIKERNRADECSARIHRFFPVLRRAPLALLLAEVLPFTDAARGRAFE